MATIAVYSLKGGVGKTTLAVNLAWCAATHSARRTLLWDLDPQGAASWLLPTAKASSAKATALFAKDNDPGKRTQATAFPRLDVIAADASLRGLDRLFEEMDRKKRLAKLTDALGDDYDRIVLDCPPGLTATAEQAMRAADLIVIPVIPSPLSQRALAEVRAHLGEKESARLIPVHMMVDRRRALHRAALAAEAWPVIPMASAIESMATQRAPVGSYAPRAAEPFAMLWRLIERRLADVD